MMMWIGYIAYVTGLQLYRMVLHLMLPFHTKARLMVQGRRMVESQLTQTLAGKPRPLWFHSASLGEFEQIRPMIEWHRQHFPEVPILVTFFSPSGYEQRKNYTLADCVCYLPFDSRANARRFIRLVNPQQAIFAKYDIWYHYLNELRKSAIPAYLVAANFRPDQIYFRWYGRFFRNMLDCFSLIFSQFDTSTELLKKSGLQHALTSGDPRYDRVKKMSTEVKPMPLIEAFAQGMPLLVLGSSYKEEEWIATASSFLNLHYKLIVVPHEVHDQRILESESRCNDYRHVRYSKLTPQLASTSQVLIIDSVGLLGSIYQYATLAIVGGGFGNSGIHNILEPLAQGAHVLTGPLNSIRFPETQQAVHAGVLNRITNAADLDHYLSRFASPEVARQSRNACIAFIESQTGATNVICESIFIRK